MLTRKGNLICKALVFALVVITAMTLDSCCDDCLGGSKSNNNPKLIINNPKPGGTETSDEDKEKAGFKKTKDDKFWIFETPLFYSAKNNGKFYSVKNGDLCVEDGEKKDNCNIFEDILIKYLKGFNSDYKNIEINNIKVENDYIPADIPIKVVFIGNVGVGKSQICNVGTGKDDFKDVYMPTLGFEFFTRTTNINNGKIFKLQIWDACGQEIYRNIVIGFFMNAQIFILGCDVTNKESFEDLENIWYEEIKKSAPKGAAIFIVVNKCDLKKVVEPDAVKYWIKDKYEQK